MEDVSQLQVIARRFRGDEHIGNSGKTIVDFWRWSSDLFENVQRGIFAEYVVATALGIADQMRVGWTGYDLLYGNDRIEVKSSSYLQSWKQRSLSRPIFGIGEREQWDEETGLFSDPRYVADAFVFCLFAHLEAPSANVLDMQQWQFFVVHTDTLKERFASARSISEQRLRALTAPVAFEALRAQVDAVLANPSAFLLPQAPTQTPKCDYGGARYIYAVAQRGTRENPVIVAASDYREAFSLARVDKTIASLGHDISAVRLSEVALEAILASGARDLRNATVQ
ncbi:MAG TPA: hypothetical protein VKT51_11575 [Candidatus Eremiobacteraceae bacterium]|nr:hypothetical protein [Candidatus Eremiobacteraceae bacterium]